MTSPERWRALQRVMDGALDHAPAARRAYLERACVGDAALLDEAARLLDACERADSTAGFLSSPAVEFALPLLVELADDEASPARGRDTTLADALRAALVGRYTIERELGRGGMATVFLAHDLRHDRAVAVKVVERSVAPGDADRFLHEIRIAARLTHPHVLGVHDSGEADGLLYYVMPYVEGETLRARLAREGALAPAEAVRLLRELTDAMACAHGSGVVHRDLKPENVLLSGGHAVVADFGIARALAAAGGTGEAQGALDAPGTPAYMAPEQVAGDPAMDHRADLYALGVIAYEALAGAHPFGYRSRQAMLRAHAGEVPAPLRARRHDVPPALAGLVMRLLEKDPAARPQDAEEVLRALDAALPPAPSAPHPRRVAATIAAVVVLAGGIGGYAAWLGRAAPGGAAASVTASHTVAVLPFENVGGSAADDYFSDGVADELAHALARLPGLRVVGRTSSYAFKGKAMPAQEIGRALDAGALVTGTVRRAGQRMRISAQLVGTADGKVLWDSVFESRSSDVFGVQDEFTRAIVAALAPVLGGGSTGAAAQSIERGTTDQEAYDLYMKGRYYWLRRGADNLPRAIGYFRQAVERDPGFARAHAGLALAYGVLPVFVPDPSDSAAALTMASAQRALALDSTLAEAHLALGFALDLQLHFREALVHYREGVALDPSSVTAHHLLALSLLNLGATDSALVGLRHAAELDPLATSPASAVSTTLLFARRYPEAAQAARHALSLDSTFTLAIWTLGLAQAFGGEPDSAMVTLEHGTQRFPADSRLQVALLYTYAAAGRWTDAQRVRQRLRGRDADLLDGSEPAFAELVFGNPKPLLRVFTSEPRLRRYVAAGSLLGCNPLLDPLWGDARFRAAMRSLTVRPCPVAHPWPIGRPPPSEEP